MGTASSNGFSKVDVRGTYVLSNLLQELTLARTYGRRQIILDESRLFENPVHRLSRLINESFWAALTRNMDGGTLEEAFGHDEDYSPLPVQRRVYVPSSTPDQFDYYAKISGERPDFKLSVEWLDNKITPDYLKTLNGKPGLLSLATKLLPSTSTGLHNLKGLSYVTSGQRRDHLYGWDSYFNVLGLIAGGKVEPATSLVQHLCFCIKHYGIIPQANRTYYLSRSCPPLLTDMASRVYEKIKHEQNSLEFLRAALLASIKEYHGVWIAPPRLDPITGLSRYRTGGAGIPLDLRKQLKPELETYASKYGVSLDAFVDAYNLGTVEDPDLYTFLMHERAMQESGHSNSYRFRGRCADLVTIDLNSLLYKYEKDIARIIRHYFKDHLDVPPEMCVGTMPSEGYVDRSTLWERRARRRKQAIDSYLWNEAKGMYFDYDCVNKLQTKYESATTFWALWAGTASPSQAAKLVSQALPLFEAIGGILAGTEESCGHTGLERTGLEWDYPYGWAPHQVLVWIGLQRYGYQEEAQRLTYKWLFTILKPFVDYNGVIEESYNVTQEVDPQRRGVGQYESDFKGVLTKG